MLKSVTHECNKEQDQDSTIHFESLIVFRALLLSVNNKLILDDFTKGINFRLELRQELGGKSLGNKLTVINAFLVPPLCGGRVDFLLHVHTADTDEWKVLKGNKM